MTNQEIKVLVIEALLNRDEWTKQVPSSDTEYRTRCPFCGDSEHSLNTGHLYIRIDTTDNSPMVYNCVRCGEYSGIVTSDTLSDLGIGNQQLCECVDKLNKTADKQKVSEYINGIKMRYFEYHIPEEIHWDKVAYVEKRLGLSFTETMVYDSKIITSVKDFLVENKVKTIMLKKQDMQTLEDKYIGFLSYGNSHILFRCIDERSNLLRWIKYPITRESKDNKIFYSMQGDIDILGTDTITINLAEGVLDIISARYNLGYDASNSIYIAVGGKGFRNILSYLVELGFVGSNIRINIFSDNDEMFNKKAHVYTNIEFFEKSLYRIRHYFGPICIYYNMKGKDIGVPKQDIKLTKTRL